ncbi:putative enzyme related to lactoylglutathione lyase [Ochrobactrum sp. P6BSIII]|nr:putative enzyme related to lactoylglutathione lyase [Ochrobactrum sp. P6BSIII]
MRITGKLDYLEMPAANRSLDATKSFYARAFGWSFTDYGPTYSAYSEGLDGGFDAGPQVMSWQFGVISGQVSNRCSMYFKRFARA